MLTAFKQGDVFPAPAGINRDLRKIGAHPKCVPRASGDKPIEDSFSNSIGCVFPAPAGINLFFPPAHILKGRVPRASGDKPP
ncbi:hypothetical protein IO627_001640 [Salmonella enterica subsp. enterica serovar Stourbridge]|nr:hypothetical protein [Salmonella enterica subsp. enterica serovar Stourbridge]EGK7153425.1 hypothetical protein [Salmonella enterica subsp. enterica serovar Stourbridge]EGK7270411.1 hypothetical protein [Salmonella enterica subsp. enterica serovar Stourbridge]